MTNLQSAALVVAYLCCEVWHGRAKSCEYNIARVYIQSLDEHSHLGAHRKRKPQRERKAIISARVFVHSRPQLKYYCQSMPFVTSAFTSGYGCISHGRMRLAQTQHVGVALYIEKMNNALFTVAIDRLPAYISQSGHAPMHTRTRSLGMITACDHQSDAHPCMSFSF